MPQYSSPHAMSGHEIEIAEILAAQVALAFARTAAEEQARQHEERVRFALDESLAVLSHELRTPLNAIVGWVHILQSGTLTAERSAEAIRIINRNARLQAQVIEELLDPSRIITGTLKRDHRAGTTTESPAGTPHSRAEAAGRRPSPE
jgi:signal transduction histidine kinase